MIQPLEISASPEAQKQAQPAAAATAAPAPAGKDFKSLHAAAVARAKTSSAQAGTGATPAGEKIEVPEGETWSATKPGAHYAEIVSGPRTGQFINLTHGERRGLTFAIENRDGNKVHVYGAGETEVVVKSKIDSSQVSEAARHAGPSKDQPPKGERWAPVEGHNNYADILEGKRNGLYVNISGGIRDGMAFQIVKKGDNVFHVYGTGKDKQMIQVAPKDKDDDDKKDDKKTGSTRGSSAAAEGEPAAGAATGTGGTAAPTGNQ